MAIRHCLDCDALVENRSRCLPCTKRHDNAMSRAGRRRRGKGWTRRSLTMRAIWAASFIGCAMAGDGKCRGAIQADHNKGGFQPLCSYHNSAKH